MLIPDRTPIATLTANSESAAELTGSCSPAEGAGSIARADASQPLPLIDAVVFRRFVQERTCERASNVIGIFSTHLGDMMSALKVAIATRDAEELQSLMHSLRGSGGMLGALRLVVLCRAIEDACISGMTDWNQVEELRKCLADTFATYSRFASIDPLCLKQEVQNIRWST